MNAGENSNSSSLDITRTPVAAGIRLIRPGTAAIEFTRVLCHISAAGVPSMRSDVLTWTVRDSGVVVDIYVILKEGGPASCASHVLLRLGHNDLYLDSTPLSHLIVPSDTPSPLVPKQVHRQAGYIHYHHRTSAPCPLHWCAVATIISNSVSARLPTRPASHGQGSRSQFLSTVEPTGCRQAL